MTRWTSAPRSRARYDASPWFARLARYKRELSVGAAYGALLLALALAAPTFFSSGELRGSWIRSAPVLVVAVGMTLVILARHIDISVGAQFSLCGVIAGLLARAGVPMVGVVGITLLIGAAMGAINGGLIAALGLPSNTRASSV